MKTDTPPIGLLMSMAIRYDHALGFPGYYDQPMFQQGPNPVSHRRRLESTISTMRQLWEEASGNGFYDPDKEEEYAATYERVMADEKGAARE